MSGLASVLVLAHSLIGHPLATLAQPNELFGHYFYRSIIFISARRCWLWAYANICQLLWIGKEYVNNQHNSFVHQLVLQPTFNITSVSPIISVRAVTALSTHCVVRNKRTAVVASSFNIISLITLQQFVCVSNGLGTVKYWLESFF